MISKRIKSIIISVVVCVSLIVPSTVFADGNQTKVNVERLAGQDRYDTNSKIVDKGWSSAQSVILVNANMYADAIVSAPISKEYNAPILLINGDNLSDTIKDKMKSLGVSNIIIMGGTGVISNNVEKELKSLGYNNITRYAGKNRYDTSLQVAKHLVGGTPKEAFILDGNDWQDALTISPFAASEGYPIILTDEKDQESVISNYFNGTGTCKTFVGNSSFVTKEQSTQMGIMRDCEGDTPLDVSKKAMTLYPNAVNYNNVFIAGDNTFADALSVSALAAKNENPILLTNDNNQDEVKNIIDNNKSDIKEIDVVGGEGSVNDTIMNNIVNGNDANNDNSQGNNSSDNSNPTNTNQQNNDDIIKVNDSQIDLSQYNDYLKNYKSKIKTLIQTVKPLKVAITTGDDKDYIIIHLFFNSCLGNKSDYYAKPDVGFTFYKNGNIGISMVQSVAMYSGTYENIFQAIKQYLPNETYYSEFVFNSANALGVFSNLDKSYTDIISNAILYKENKAIYNQTFLKTYGSYNVCLEVVNGVEYEIFNEIFSNLN